MPQGRRNGGLCEEDAFGQLWGGEQAHEGNRPSATATRGGAACRPGGETVRGAGAASPRAGAGAAPIRSSPSRRPRRGECRGKAGTGEGGRALRSVVRAGRREEEAVRPEPEPELGGSRAEIKVSASSAVALEAVSRCHE